MDIDGKAAQMVCARPILACLLSQDGDSVLLLLPLACVAGLCALVREWKKERAAVRYFSLFGILILGMGALYAADAAAYSAPEWKQFRQFFDDRTALYDYRLDFVSSMRKTGRFMKSSGSLRSGSSFLPTIISVRTMRWMQR